MKNIFVYIFILSSAFAQSQDANWQKIIESEPTSKYRMHSALYQIGKYAESTPSSRSAHRSLIPQLTTRDDQRINVEIVYGEDMSQEIDRSFLDKIGANVSSTWKNRASCWLYTQELLDVAKKLPEPFVMLPVFDIPTDNQGPGLMNSDGYVSGGANGNGVRIAVLDSGFDNLTESILLNVAPGAYGTNYDWTGSGLQSGTTHGTNCLETVFDHAPGATYYLHKIGNTTDMGNAVDQAISDGVDVITHSISRYNTGWGDNSGPACSAAQDAVDAGMLFFTSAGNRNGTHWQGGVDDDDNDNWHEWSGLDERNNFTIAPDGDCNIRMQWNSSPILDHYNLYLYDANTNALLASSTSLFSFEQVAWTNPSSINARSVYVAVRKGTLIGGKPTFELFNHDSGSSDFEYASSSNSTTSPSNTTAGNVISVGAVHRNSYNSAPGTSGISSSYSSRGPSNSGNSVLDLIAPTSTQTSMGFFSGTSCSTPNAAGAAAAFWSANSNLTATGVRQILLRKAALYNDWGADGTDNIYGRGGMALYDHFSPIRYIYASSGNNVGNSQRAYINMHQADNNAPNNSRVVFLGGTFPEPPANFIFDRPLIYVSAVIDSRVE